MTRLISRTVYCLFLLAPLTWAPGTAAPRIPKRVETSGLALITPQTQQSINRGLAYLASQQNEDGSFGATSVYRRNVAVASLCAMAFLSAGNTPGRGQYGPHVEKTTRFVLAAARPDGFIHIPEGSSHGPMYDHGFATLFLAEVYGMTMQPEIREKLTLAIKLIVSCQNKEGGWRYQPQRSEADVSVTVCQVMALRAARNCGIAVPKQTIENSITYLNNCQNPDGGFKYQLLRGSQSAFPRSAAALVALYSAGVYEGRNVERGLRYVDQFIPQGDVFRHESHYFYGHYYAVQAMWQAGDQYWDRWYPAIRDELVARQSLGDGSWSDPSVCNEYGTAMACIVLQMPNNYLPIFQR